MQPLSAAAPQRVRVVQVVPGVAIGFCTYELMRKALDVQTNVGLVR